jgi:Spy/CpxP family protein refolding chaperone
MLRRLLTPTLAAALLVAACDSGPTSPPSAAALSDDYALTMFGEIGTALEGTMGTQPTFRPFDGRSAFRHFPDSIALTDEQRAEMLALRQAFRAEYEDELNALRAIFLEARAARLNGATREEVRAILEQGREIAEVLRPALAALHEALWEVLTPEQQAWLIAHRPNRFPPPIVEP